jgi:hypothetical protein
MAGQPTSRRNLRLEELLEELGFEMTANLLPGNFRLLRPEGLRLAGLTDLQPERLGVPVRPRLVEGDEYLYWRGYEYVEVDEDEARRCFWEFIESRETDPRAVHDFNSYWGLVKSAGEPDLAGWSRVDSFTKEVLQARSFLVTLAATEAGDLVPDAVLESLDEPDPEFSSDVWDLLALQQGFELPGRDVRAAVLEAEERRARRQRMRNDGVGLELQRILISSFLDEKYALAPGWPTWDSRGRRIERIVTGVENIVWAHLHSLFTATQIDIYVCGICGKPFEFDEAAFERRPRKGVRRLCSDACRLEAKRASNRESWQKNSQRWRPGKSGRKKDGSQG